MNLFDSYQAISPVICSNIRPEKGSINSPVQIENSVLVNTLELIVLGVFSPSGIKLSSLSSLWCPAAKKPSDAAPAAAKKPPAPKAKKPDKSIWDSDSDTASKNPAPGLKGTQQSLCFSHLALDGLGLYLRGGSTSVSCSLFYAGKGRGRKRKASGSEEDYSPAKKMAKSHGKVSVLQGSLVDLDH